MSIGILRVWLHVFENVTLQKWTSWNNNRQFNDKGQPHADPQDLPRVSACSVSFHGIVCVPRDDSPADAFNVCGRHCCNVALAVFERICGLKTIFTNPMLRMCYPHASAKSRPCCQARLADVPEAVLRGQF